MVGTSDSGDGGVNAEDVVLGLAGAKAGQLRHFGRCGVALELAKAGTVLASTMDYWASSRRMGNVERAEIRSGFEDGEDDRATHQRAMSTSACIPSRNDRAGGARARSGLVIAPGPIQQITAPHAPRPLLLTWTCKYLY